MKDSYFSVYSNPKFLYIMGKICARSKVVLYADHAIQSFHDYFLIVTYYRPYMTEAVYREIKVKTFMWIARVFLQCNELE